jgi:plastocyanin
VKQLSVIIGAAMLTVAACGGSSSDAAAPASSSAAAASSAPAVAASSAPAVAVSSAPASATPAPVVLTIKDFAFTVPATVPAGATIRVTNADGEAHTVTADSGGAFDTMVGGGASASFTAPAKPGRYPFHCEYHSNMHGVLVVS